MKVLLTGATGFIGSHVARICVREGCEVYTLIRKGADLWRIKDIVKRLHTVPCDLLSSEAVKTCLEKIRPDLCLHLAWYTEPGKYLTSYENIRMLNATLNLASHLADMDCKRFVATGTCFEYNTHLGYLTETSLTKPRNLYAASKLALSLVLEQIASLTEMEVAWLRLFYLFGPFEDKRRLVPSVILSLLHNQVVKATAGEQVRDYLHVEDVAAAVWAVAQSDLTGTVNIGSGRPVAVRDIVTRIGDLLGKPELIVLGAMHYAANDPMFICAKNYRLRESTTWVPYYDLDRGLFDTVEWWKQYMTGL